MAMHGFTPTIERTTKKWHMKPFWGLPLTDRDLEQTWDLSQAYSSKTVLVKPKKTTREKWYFKKNDFSWYGTSISGIRYSDREQTYMYMIQSITENNNREKQPNFMTEMRFQRE